MYKLNIVGLLNESEVIEKDAKQLDNCINNLKKFEASLSAMNGDDELFQITAAIKEKMENQMQTIHRISYVLSAVSNTVALGNKKNLVACEKDSGLQESLVANMLKKGSRKLNPLTLPINITISD